MIKNCQARTSKLLVAGVSAGFALAASLAFADTTQEIVVEAAAPAHTAHSAQGAPGGAQVDMLSVRFHVHTQGLDLTKHADVMALDEQIKTAAKRGCDSIKAQYPTRSMSDDQTCVNDAIKSASVQEKAAIAAAQPK